MDTQPRDRSTEIPARLVDAAIAASARTGLYTEITTYGGSVLIAHNTPEAIWRDQVVVDRALYVELVGGGAVVIPCAEVAHMVVWRPSAREDLTRSAT